MHKFDTIHYLKSGNKKQQEAYTILSSGIMDWLNPFTPILAGTIPLGIDIETSDLDILCYWTSKSTFIETLKLHYECYPKYRLRTKLINGAEAIIANFELGGFKIEIFGQNVPVTQQQAYIHMMNEEAILEKMGENFRNKIIELKLQGYKTEPAFAKLLNLEGDPYAAIMAYKL